MNLKLKQNLEQKFEQKLLFYQYKFRVMAVNAEGAGEPLEQLGTMIARDPFDCADRPGKPFLAGEYLRRFISLPINVR